MKGCISMKNTWKKTVAGLAFLTLALSSFASCSAQNGLGSDVIKNTTNTYNEAEDTDEVATASQAEKVSNKSLSAAVINTSNIFSDRDLTQSPDTSAAVKLTAEDGKIIDITEEGVYILSGSAKNCTVKIDAGKDAKVQLVLDGADIENDDFPAVYIVSADKVFVTTTAKENILAVNNEFRADGETNTNAVIFSKSDLVLNGTGTLSVYSAYANGISCKDDLKVTGGTYKVTSAKDAFEANDSLSVYNGDFTIKTNKDGFNCENSDDDTLGQIYIAGGSFVIDSLSDGIQGTTYVQIDGGTFNITSSEGIEATYVQINGGNINIDASDDGINASRKSTACDIVIEFNGGETTITMGQGDTDGVDSNGVIIVNGGTIDVTAQLSSFDYETSAEFNGGIIIVNGEEVDEIPQSMMGGPGGMGGFRGSRDGNGSFNGTPDGDFTPPDGFSGEDFTPPDGFKSGDFMPPEGFDAESGATEKFKEWSDSNRKPSENFTPNNKGENETGDRQGGFKGGHDSVFGGFDNKNKAETGGFIERT